MSWCAHAKQRWRIDTRGDVFNQWQNGCSAGRESERASVRASERAMGGDEWTVIFPTATADARALTEE